MPTSLVVKYRKKRQYSLNRNGEIKIDKSILPFFLIRVSLTELSASKTVLCFYLPTSVTLEQNFVSFMWNIHLLVTLVYTSSMEDLLNYTVKNE